MSSPCLNCVLRKNQASSSYLIGNDVIQDATGSGRAAILRRHRNGVEKLSLYCSSISSSLWVEANIEAIFAIGNHKNNQPMECCPVQILTDTLHEYHIIASLQIHFMNAIIARNHRILKKTW